jgi:copper transport protein
MLSLAGTLIGVGALVFAAAVLRGDPRDIRHVLHWVRRAGVFVVVGAIIELVAQLAVDSGGRWSGVWSLSSLSSVLFSSFGIAVGLRLAGGVALSSGARIDIARASEAPDPVLAIRELVGVGAGPANEFWGIEGHTPRHGQPASASEPYIHPGDHAWLPSVDSVGAMLGGLAILAAHLFDGHTVTKGNRLFTGMVDLVHVAGGAVWAGGVLMLASVLWRRHRQGRELRALQLALRFSVVATIALVAVGVAGLVLTVIVLDGPAELWTTQWGRLLMLKTLFVAGAAGAGGYNHKVLIPQMDRAPNDPALASQFRTIVTGEAVALVAVLVVTAFLMGAAS